MASVDVRRPEVQGRVELVQTLPFLACCEWAVGAQFCCEWAVGGPVLL